MPSLMPPGPSISSIGDLGNLDKGPLKMLPDLDKDNDDMPGGEQDIEIKGLDRDGDGDHDMGDHDMEKDDSEPKDDEKKENSVEEKESIERFNDLDTAHKNSMEQEVSANLSLRERTEAGRKRYGSAR
jgi:hypothetical protein